LFATTEVAAFLGIGLAAAAYLPQILHLSRARCSAGISRAAFGMWFLAALLVTSHAVATDARVFIALGLVQILATAVVLVYATRYASSYCAGHEPGRLATIHGSTEAPRNGPLEAPSRVAEDIGRSIRRVERRLDGPAISHDPIAESL
jgi:acyl dehydratase